MQTRDRSGETVGSVPAPRLAQQDVVRACVGLLGIEPHRIEYPGGRNRRSVRAITATGTCIVTQRKHAARADLEVGVLRELRALGAPVPAVLAYDGRWMIQQDVGAQRLATALAGADAAQRATQALTGLLLCQRAAQTSGLAGRVAPIGLGSAWLAALLATPARLARRLELPDPDVASAISGAQLLPQQLAFVKWDARPGNAIVTADDGLAWVDWEHCGARDALDDLAWLLCDEYMPDDAALEAALLERFLPLFALLSRRNLRDASIYLARIGSLHSGVRLGLVLQNKGQGDWWPAEACERTDRVGVTAAAARGLCLRGARWSARVPGGERLQRFFLDADARLRDPAFASSPVVSGPREAASHKKPTAASLAPL